MVAATFLIVLLSAWAGAESDVPNAGADTGSAAAAVSNEGMIAEVLSETDLFSEPDELATTQGRLPKGTLLRLLGKRKGAFENIEVELVDGVAEGWVRRKALNLARQEEQIEKLENRTQGSRVRKAQERTKESNAKNRMYVPEDEVLLIRRQPSFFYGLVAEAPLFYITDDANNFFSGLNYRLGAHVGFFFSRNSRLRFEVAFANVAGTADDVSPAGSGAPLDLSVVDIRSQGEIGIGSFAVLAYVQYSLGTGIEAAPASFSNLAAADFSAFWVGAGLGYRMGLSPTQNLLVQLTYGLSISRSPIGYQAFGLRLLWEIEG